MWLGIILIIHSCILNFVDTSKSSYDALRSNVSSTEKADTYHSFLGHEQITQRSQINVSKYHPLSIKFDEELVAGNYNRIRIHLKHLARDSQTDLFSPTAIVMAMKNGHFKILNRLFLKSMLPTLENLSKSKELQDVNSVIELIECLALDSQNPPSTEFLKSLILHSRTDLLKYILKTSRVPSKVARTCFIKCLLHLNSTDNLEGLRILYPIIFAEFKSRTLLYHLLNFITSYLVREERLLSLALIIEYVSLYSLDSIIDLSEGIIKGIASNYSIQVLRLVLPYLNVMMKTGLDKVLVRVLDYAIKEDNLNTIIFLNEYLPRTLKYDSYQHLICQCMEKSLDQGTSIDIFKWFCEVAAKDSGETTFANAFDRCLLKKDSIDDHFKEYIVNSLIPLIEEQRLWIELARKKDSNIINRDTLRKK